MKYIVSFVQYYHYEIDAESEDSAFDNAYKEFLSEMRSSVANTMYDEVEIICKRNLSMSSK